MAVTKIDQNALPSIPWFGARRMARELVNEVQSLRLKNTKMHEQLDKLGAFSIIQLEAQRKDLERLIAEQMSRLEHERSAAMKEILALKEQIEEVRKTLVITEDLALLQEAGVYHYRHPLTDAVSYENKLAMIEQEIKAMTRIEGGAVLGTTNWTVNGSAAQGRTMVRDFSKLMLRAFNAEADNLVRGLKPYKLSAAVNRLTKVSETIARLGKTMQVRISTPYLKLRLREFELTADYLQKQAEEKEAERIERERLREERKVQQEIERERQRLEKERQHYLNALEALSANGDEEGAARLHEQLNEVQKAIEDVDYRAANIRAGYVYVVSNIGSFGERMVKIGMTRRLDPMDRIRELSDASVPFNFDIHAIFFSKDAVGIEAAMHEKFGDLRVNAVNRRREFFYSTPLEVKVHLAELAGELLQFQDVPEALEYRQSLTRGHTLSEPSNGN